jgi:uncharacterized protein YwgA
MLLTAGEVRGRKKLQKMVFIAQCLGFPFPEPFDLHVWGPYSEVLTVKVKEMTDWGFAREEALPGPAGNQQYVYTPGPNAARVCEDEPVSAQLCDLVSHLNSQDATFLEGVATVMFLRAKGKPDDVVSQMVSRLKPDKFGDPVRVEAAMIFADQLEGYRAACL